MYSVGRIEDGIKRGKIVDTEASMMEKRRNSFDEHVQAMFKKRRSKRKLHTTREELVDNHPHSSSYAQVPQAGFSSPQKFVQKRDRDSDSSYPRGKKRRSEEHTSELHKSIDDQHVIVRRGQSVHKHEIFFSTSEGWLDH